jgi:type I restriction-modification system DNA methylase subunit
VTPDELKQLEANLWQSADTLRANSDLISSEYSTPVLGLIFLKFADNKYRQHEMEIQQEHDKFKGTRREKDISEIAIAKCGFYLPDRARYDYLLKLPDSKNIAEALKDAMTTIEEHKPELKGVLPQDEYFRLVRGEDKSIPKRLLKNFADIPADATGDMFGQIYQYFLGKFALAEGNNKRTQIDRQIKALKTTLEMLHAEVKSAESYFTHISWLQERFPNAEYEDVTGLCKLATLEEVKEQDYSLNPGRYVGVVIEEDGKTEEEFIEEILELNKELEQLNREAHELESIIAHNTRQIAGDD